MVYMKQIKSTNWEKHRLWELEDNEGFGCVFIYFYISPGCIHSPIVRAALGSNVDQRAKDFSITPKKNKNNNCCNYSSWIQIINIAKNLGSYKVVTVSYWSANGRND